MLNNVVLMGRLTADPELRHTPNDIPVTSFTLAVERSYSKSKTERQADFIDIVAWRSTAEFVCRYFHKGQLVAVQGSLQTRTYQDKQGNNRKASEVVADSVHFAEPKRDYSNQPQKPSNNQAESFNEPSPAFDNGATDEFQTVTPDDDLPF